MKDRLSLNLYTYCDNDPVDKIDPTGHNVEESNSNSEKSSSKKSSTRKNNSGKKTKWGRKLYQKIEQFLTR